MFTDRRLIKVYGLLLAKIGALLLFIDIIIMTAKAEAVSFSINPFRMLIEFLNVMIYCGTGFPLTIVSEICMALSLIFFVAFLFSLFKFLKSPREQRNRLSLAVPGGISLFLWMVHAVCTINTFTMDSWIRDVGYAGKKFLILEGFILWCVSVIFIFLASVIPPGKAGAFRRVISYGLVSMAVFYLADDLFFGLINILFHGRSVAEFPLLGFMAMILVGMGGFIISESRDLLGTLQKVDGVIKLSSVMDPPAPSQAAPANRP